MKHYKGFVPFVPTSPLPDDFPMENIGDPNIEYECRRHHLAELAKGRDEQGMKPLFEHDQYGKCWYDCIHEFAKDTTKIVYCKDTGRVVSYHTDASALFPHGDNVIEVAVLPEGFEANTWKVNEHGHLVRYAEEILAGNQLKQARLLQWACAHLVALQIMQDKSASELAEMGAIEEYMVKVKRMKLTQVNVEWPTSPV